MTILKGKYRVKNSQNEYDIVHLETSASQVRFDDGKTFQDKLNSGELKGDKGDKGDTGARGETGASGKDGLTTSVTVDGVKYTHANGNITLPNYPTLSSLGGEPANSNIQSHITSPHAPANAQKNSDITKAEIEAKLTGTISTHNHDYSKLINKPDLSVYATQTYVSDEVADLTNQIGTKADKSSVYTKSEVDQIVSSSTSINDGAVNTLNTWSSQKINTELNNKANKSYVDQELSKKSDVHTHPYKSDTYVPNWGEITGKPSTYTPTSHNHNELYYDKNTVDGFVEPIDNNYIDELFGDLDDTSNPIDFYSKEESDNRFATKSEVEALGTIDPSSFATKNHKHVIDDIIDFDAIVLKAKDIVIEDKNDMFVADTVESALIENRNSILSLREEIREEILGQKNQLITTLNSLINEL